MTGMEVAWRTLNLEPVHEPCILTHDIMKPELFEVVTGRDFFADPVTVASDAFRRLGANLCPQLSLPYHGPAGERRAKVLRLTQRSYTAEQIRDAIDTLPDPSSVHATFDIERTRDDYAASLIHLRDLTGDDILWLAGFGQSDFMGGFARWRYENYLECFALYPEHMRHYFEYTAEQAYLFNTAVVAAIQDNDLAPFVYGGQELCHAKGPFCSPALLREYYFPTLRRAIDPLIKNDIRIIWPCLGNILPILDDLIDLGIAGFRGFDESAGVTLEKMAGLRTLQGRKPILWGSIDTSQTLRRGTIEDVQREVERCFDIAAPGGGFALAGSGPILPDTPIENILTLFEHGRAYGRAVLR